MVAINRLKNVKGHFKKYAKKDVYVNENNLQNYTNPFMMKEYDYNIDPLNKRCFKQIPKEVKNCNNKVRLAYCNGSIFRNPLSGYRKKLNFYACTIKTEEIYKDPYALWSKKDVCYDKRIRSINNKGGTIDRNYNHSYKEYLRRKCKSYSSHEKRILQSDGTYKTNCKLDTGNCTMHKSTIYKPKNKQYKTNSAVPSSSRIERLKYNTLMQTNKNTCTSGSRKDQPSAYTCGNYSSIQKNKDINTSPKKMNTDNVTPCIRKKIRVGGVMRWSR